MPLPKCLTSPYTMGSAAAIGGGVLAMHALGGSNEISKEDGNDPSLPIPISFQENSCFNSLFPKITSSDKAIQVVKSENEGVEQEKKDKEKTEIDASKYIQKFVFPELGKDEQIRGCMGMKLSHDLSATPSPFGAFNMGTAMKGDRAGFVLYVDGVGGMSQTEEIKYGQFMKYSLLLMEKGEGDLGNVKGGYSWKDNEISGNEFKLYISDFGGNSLIDIKGGAQYHGGAFFHGCWNSDSDPTSQTIFGQMEIKGQKTDGSLIVGRKKPFKEMVDGWKIFLNEVYNPETRTWIPHKDSEFDLGEVLDAWYVPFVEKTGKWEQSEEDSSSEEEDDSETYEEDEDESEYDEDDEEYEDEEEEGEDE